MKMRRIPHQLDLFQAKKLKQSLRLRHLAQQHTKSDSLLDMIAQAEDKVFEQVPTNRNRCKSMTFTQAEQKPAHALTSPVSVIVIDVSWQ